MLLHCQLIQRGLSKRSCKPIDLNINGEPFGVIFGAESIKATDKIIPGSIEHRAMMREIHHLDHMLQILFKQGCLLYSDDANDVVHLSSLWELVLGSFDAFSWESEHDCSV